MQRFFGPLLLLLLSASFVTAQVEIESVDVGLGATYRLGKWTPVRITTHASTETAGQFEISAKDGEGVACTYVFANQGIARETTTQTYLVRLGQPSTIEVRFRSDGDVIAEHRHDDEANRITAWQQWVLSIGSDVNLGDSTRQFRRPANEQVVGTHVSDIASLPEDWLAYDGVDLILVTTAANDLVHELSAPQFEAIRDWVSNGGRIVISAAASADSLMGQGGPLADLAPGPFVEVMKQRQTTGLEEYAETSQRLDTLLEDETGRVDGMPTAIFELREGIVEVEEGFGRERSAWLIRRAYGLGIVTLLTADLDATPMSEWQPRARFVHRLLDEALAGKFDEVEETRRGQVTHVGYKDLTGQMRTAMEQFRGVRLVPFSLIAGLAVAYILLIGPIDMLFLRRFLGKMHFTWLTFPLVVLGMAGIAAWFATEWKGSEIRVNEVHLIDIDEADGDMKCTTWAHVYTPKTQDLEIGLMPAHRALVNGCQIERQALAWQGLPGTGFGAMSAVSRHGMFFRPYEIFDSGAARSTMALRKLSMPKWASRSVSGVTYGTIPEFEAGQLTENRDGLLDGEIANPLNVPIRDAAVCFGRWYFELPALEPGQKIRIQDAMPKDLRTYLTKRTSLASESSESNRVNQRELASPWDPESLELGRIVQMMMFHDAAGGRLNYTKLLHRFEGSLDMSDLIKTKRAVLFGKVGRSVTNIAINGEPNSDPQGARLSYCRIVFPVAREPKSE